MAGKAKFRHEDVSEAPRGWKVRTVSHPSGHRVRVAFPPGRRKKGSGKLVSILHPLTGNPCPNPCAFKNEPRIAQTLSSAPAKAKAKLAAVKEKVTAFFSGKKPAIREAGANPRNYHELVKDSSGKPWYVDVVSSGKRYMAEGYPVRGGKVKTVGRPVIAYGTSESEAYDALIAKVEKNPKRKKSKGKGQKAKGKNAKPRCNAGHERCRKYRDRCVPMEEFAYVGDPERSTTYKLRLDDAAHVRDAMARFSRTQLPRTARKSAYEKITAAAKKFGIEVRRFAARKPNRHKKGRRNLDEIQQAAKLHEKFVGSPAEKVVGIDEPRKVRDDYAHLGWMEQMVFHPPFDRKALDLGKISREYDAAMQDGGDPVRAWKDIADRMGTALLVFDCKGDEIRLAASSDGKQLYFLGGKQAGFADHLQAFKADTEHDRVDLGELVSLTYSAKKKQAGDDREHPYYHIFGEEGGTAPRAFFDSLNKRIGLVGGNYHLKEAELGIVN